jgi:hypothetical protein
MDPRIQGSGSGSTPKCHGSGTLVSKAELMSPQSLAPPLPSGNNKTRFTAKKNYFKKLIIRVYSVLVLDYLRAILYYVGTFQISVDYYYVRVGGRGGGAGERGMESIIVYLTGSTMYPTMYGTWANLY